MKVLSIFLLIAAWTSLSQAEVGLFPRGRDTSVCIGHGCGQDLPLETNRPTVPKLSVRVCRFIPTDDLRDTRLSLGGVCGINQGEGTKAQEKSDFSNGRLGILEIDRKLVAALEVPFAVARDSVCTSATGAPSEEESKKAFKKELKKRVSAFCLEQLCKDTGVPSCMFKADAFDAKWESVAGALSQSGEPGAGIKCEETPVHNTTK